LPWGPSDDVMRWSGAYESDSLDENDLPREAAEGVGPSAPHAQQQQQQQGAQLGSRMQHQKQNLEGEALLQLLLQQQRQLQEQQLQLMQLLQGRQHQQQPQQEGGGTSFAEPHKEHLPGGLEFASGFSSNPGFPAGASRDSSSSSSSTVEYPTTGEPQHESAVESRPSSISSSSTGSQNSNTTITSSSSSSSSSLGGHHSSPIDPYTSPSFTASTYQTTSLSIPPSLVLPTAPSMAPRSAVPPSLSLAPPHASAAVPGDLVGHVVLAGCPASFVPFAKQLMASCPQGATPHLVVLHPTKPSGVLAELHGLLPGRVYYICGSSSESHTLQAAGAKRARCLVYVSSVQRPQFRGRSGGVERGDGDNSLGEYGSISRAAVLADAEALLTCYGTGEDLLPDMMHTVVELGFTSSVRFLQPGLLLHGKRPPGGISMDQGDPQGSAWARVWDLVRSDQTGRGLGGLKEQVGEWISGLGRGFWYKGGGGAMKTEGQGKLRSPPLENQINHPKSSSSSTDSSFLSKRGHEASRGGTRGIGGATTHISSKPLQNHTASEVQGHSPPNPTENSRLKPTEGSSLNPTESSRKPQVRRGKPLPRTSWRHRKQVEAAGRAEGLTEWQMNSYYAAGRVVVPALLDTFTCQAFFKRRQLMDLLTELAGREPWGGGREGWGVGGKKQVVRTSTVVSNSIHEGYCNGLRKGFKVQACSAGCDVQHEVRNTRL
jgi:hypothetical protein